MKQQLTLEEYSWANNTLTFTVRNDGTAAIELQSIAINETVLPGTVSNCKTIEPAKSCKLTVQLPFTPSPGKYALKLAPMAGAPFLFSISYEQNG